MNPILPDLYHRILSATKSMHGWCEPAKQLSLANLVLAIQPRTILEVGVWGGMSLIPMALASDSATIYAVDPWSASESIKGQEEKDANWWGNEVGQPQHEFVYNNFIAKLMELNLRQRVIVKRMTSDDFMPPSQVDIFHCDGNHGPQALKDVQRFCPAIPSGGICILDDLNWTGGNVGKAAEWLKQNGFMELHPLGTGAVYLKL